MNHSKMIAAKRIAVAVAAACATLSAPAFAANDTKNLLDLMLKKGVITQAEYDEYMKSDAYENSQFKDQRIDQDVSKSVKFMQAREKDGAVKENGFGFKSANGQHEINLTGRVHFDTRFINSDFASGDSNDKDSGGLANNFEVRRARIGFNGKVFKDIGFELVTNALGSNPNLIDTAFINYGFNPAAQVRVGRFKQGFSLEELTSSNNIDFMERSYVNQFIPGKQLGAMVYGVPAVGTTYSASLYQTGFSQSMADGGLEGAARLTANFAEIGGTKDAVLHFGLAATTGEYSAIPTTSSSGGTTTALSILALRSEARGVNALRLRQAGSAATSGFSAPSPSGTTVSRDLIGAEAALAYGATKLQAELVEAKYSAQHSGVADVAGKARAYYVQAVYNITGEAWADNYKDGAFGSLKIKNNFNPSGSGYGAWQIGLRYSSYDASDIWANTATANNNRLGSDKGNTTTLGLTWFMNPNARIMLNYSKTKFNTAFRAIDLDSPAPQSDTEDVIAIRTQFNF